MDTLNNAIAEIQLFANYCHEAMYIRQVDVEEFAYGLWESEMDTDPGRIRIDPN